MSLRRVLLLLACASTLVAPPVRSQDEDVAAKLSELLKLYADAGRFRGAALVALKDEVLLSQAFGLADERWQIANTVDTRFACASLSKTFTAAAVLVLAEKGRIDLESPVGAYLPELRQDIGNVVTAIDLLTHTSGVRREVFEDAKETHDLHRPDQILEKINSSPLRSTPGEEHAYSNTGYVLLRLIVESVHGKDFATCVEDLVFAPAGMGSSGYWDPAKVQPRMASGYDIILGEPVPAEWPHPSNNLGAGGMFTTVGDLNSFDQALRSGTLLSAETRKLRIDQRRFGWGLGWQLMPVGESESGEPLFAVYHNGDYSGIGTHYFRFPDEGLVIALLSNQSDLPRTELFSKITAVINGAEPTGPEPRLADELYRVVVDQGEEAGLAFAAEARAAGRRGIPGAMQAIQVGNALSRMGRDEATRRVYAFAALADPTAPWGHLGLGKWMEDHGRWAEAQESYRRVLAQDPDQPHALEYLQTLRER